MKERCGAVGAASGTVCANTSAVQTYAVTAAGSWLPPGAIAATDVAPTSGATTCNGASGKFYRVTISSSLFAGALPTMPFGSMNVSVTACYPMA